METICIITWISENVTGWVLYLLVSPFLFFGMTLLCNLDMGSGYIVSIAVKHKIDMNQCKTDLI